MFSNYPPEVARFLESQSVNLDDCVNTQYTVPRAKTILPIKKFALDIFRTQIEPFYQDRGINAQFAVYNLLSETLKNAVFHSQSDAAIQANLMVSPSALLFDINDGGEYFTRPDIKSHWEAKEKHPQRHEAGVKGVGYNRGTIHIYGFSDLIFVQNSTATLYLGVTVPSKYVH